jgi:uncharacterized protein (TIGR00369 family)
MAVISEGRWIPRNAAYADMVRDSFARQPLMATLGARIARVAPGECDVAAEHSPSLCQQNGFLHAGAVASLADTANGYAAFSLAPAGHDVLAVEFKINLLAPARGERFEARGRVVRPGRTLTVCLCEMVAFDGGQENVVATMLSTLIIRPVEALEQPR